MDPLLSNPSLKFDQGAILTSQSIDHGTVSLGTSMDIGQVLSVRGSEAHIGLPAPWPRDQARATVGRFIAISTGVTRLVGVVTEVTAKGVVGARAEHYGALARIDLMGEIKTDADGALCFRRGVSEYPAIGDPASIIASDELRLIHKASGNTITIGHLHHEASIPAYIDVDHLLTKHFAILGSTGVGKSSGVAVILGEILDVRPDVRIFMLDGHNEYGTCFGDRANVVTPRNFKLPFWLFNFEEIVDVFYGGRPGIDEELEILAELIPIAKSNYTQYKSSADRSVLKRSDPKSTGFTVDTPVPYLLQDLVALIDERMGKLENRSSRMNYHRLMMRIEMIRNDTRYDFMFENANVGGDTMSDLLVQLFRLEANGKPMTVMQLASLPVEVVDSVVCVLCRLAFDFGMWSDGAMPMLFVCEEAHRYASADHGIGFGPTRRALSRIAKEGRKYGVYLGLVTQRPAELDPTIISQCSTLFAMRMANDLDQAILRSAVTDTAANLLAFIASLGTREVIAFGEGVPLPARMTFKSLAEDNIPRGQALQTEALGSGETSDKDFVRAVVERWRGASLGRKSRPEDADDLGGSGSIGRLDQTRYQLLKR